MRRTIVAAALAVGLGIGGALAQDAGADIRAVIASQMEAFKADDFATAFTFASPTIRDIFGTPERFGEMVTTGYPMVWRPADVRFAGLVERGGRTVQSVMVTDARGALHVLDYEMVELETGWKINGVSVRQADGPGA